MIMKKSVEFIFNKCKMRKNLKKIFYKNFGFHMLLLRYYITKIINCISFL